MRPPVLLDPDLGGGGGGKGLINLCDFVETWAIGPDIGLMLGQRRRRWPNIKPISGQSLVLARLPPCSLAHKPLLHFLFRPEMWRADLSLYLYWFLAWLLKRSGAKSWPGVNTIREQSSQWLSSVNKPSLTPETRINLRRYVRAAWRGYIQGTGVSMATESVRSGRSRETNRLKSRGMKKTPDCWNIYPEMKWRIACVFVKGYIARPSPIQTRPRRAPLQCRPTAGPELNRRPRV